VISAVEKSPESFLTISQIWVISPNGQTKAITSGLIAYEGLSSTSDGTVLLTHQVKGDNNLWLIPNNDTSKARPVTTSGEIIGGFTTTPDGHIITGSKVSGNINLWSMDLDGGNRKQLTREGGRNAQPVVSPDNKYIVFISDRGDGRMRPYRMERGGQNVKLLADWTGDIIPLSTRISNDGKWVFYIELHNGNADTVRKVSIDGGEAITVANPPDKWEFTNLDINRTDGRIACGLVSKVDGPRLYKVGIIPANGNAVTTMIDLPEDLRTIGNLHWTPNGKSVAMVEKLGVEVWQVPVDGKGTPTKLTEFKKSLTYNFNWSFDGKFMLAGRGIRISEPILIRMSAN
jgi:Tol biopolymer transport system component